MTGRSKKGRIGLVATVAVAGFAAMLPLHGFASSRATCTITGTEGPDTLTGTSRADVICALGGDDTITGLGGNDTINGGAGNDVIYPGPGKDLVYGGPGDDLLYAVDSTRDILSGGAGLDRARVDRKANRTLDRTTGIEGFFPTATRYPVLVAAGDIADCEATGDSQTSALLDAFPYATVAPLGDNAYPSGTAEEFRSCYAPTWGHVLGRTKPTPGNHDYLTPGASGYFGYFGSRAGAGGTGYFSYDLGRWHLVSLNSNCAAIPGGCAAGSPQEQWLRNDLATHRTACTLAYWHHPRFSSGTSGSHGEMEPIWAALYDNGVDVVLNGHDHGYERFAPQTPVGVADPVRGIREFVVGTGGQSHGFFPTTQPNSEIRNAGTFGLIRLTLRPSGYDWEFVPVAGKLFSERGSGTCH